MVTHPNVNFYLSSPRFVVNIEGTKKLVVMEAGLRVSDLSDKVVALYVGCVGRKPILKLQDPNECELDEGDRLSDIFGAPPSVAAAGGGKCPRIMTN